MADAQPVSLKFDTVPSGCTAALQLADKSWQPLMRLETSFELPRPALSGAGSLHFRLGKTGYRNLEVDVPTAALLSGLRRWPSRADEYLQLNPRIVQVDLVTHPPGAQVWLPLPGGDYDYRAFPAAPWPSTWRG